MIFGTIEWIGNTTFTQNMTTYGDLTFPGNILIEDNMAYVNSSAFTGERINSSHNITLYGIATDMVIPKIYKDGAECSDCYNFTSLNAGTVIFNVSQIVT